MMMIISPSPIIHKILNPMKPNSWYTTIARPYIWYETDFEAQWNTICEIFRLYSSIYHNFYNVTQETFEPVLSWLPIQSSSKLSRLPVVFVYKHVFSCHNVYVSADERDRRTGDYFFFRWDNGRCTSV